MLNASRRSSYKIAIALLITVSVNCSVTAAGAKHSRKFQEGAYGQTNSNYYNVPAYQANPSDGEFLEGRVNRADIDASEDTHFNNPNRLSGYTASRAFRPLEGKIERQNADGGLVDLNDFQGRPGAAQADSLRIPRQAGASTTKLNAGVPAFSGAKRQRLKGDVADKDLLKLKTYDVVVMQDRSSSMGEDEHILGMNGEGFRKVSRWEWCREQAWSFTRQTSSLPNWAFTLVLFSSKYNIFPQVGLGQIPYIYDRSGIYIGTKLCEPLGEQLSQYFQRRSTGKARPLLIAVITDGKPQDDEDLRDLLVQTTRHMRSPNEIKITFLQVGSSDEGSKKLFKLDQKLLRHGAKYDIVNVKPFGHLMQTGLTRALIETIQGS